MVKIKMTGEFINEQHDTRKFFWINEDGESSIDREAAGMFALVWYQSNKLNMYEEDGCTYWELLD